MYEVSGKSATFQKTKCLCQHGRWLGGTGKETCITAMHHAGYRAGLEWKEKDRGTHVSVYFYNYYCSKHNHSQGETIFSR